MAPRGAEAKRRKREQAAAAEAEVAEVAEAEAEPAAAPADKKSKKRKLEAAEVAEVAETAEADTAPASTGKEKKKPERPLPRQPSTRKREAAEVAEVAETAEAETAPANFESAVDEDIRRKAQKEIQQLVVRLRKEGKSEQDIKQAKWDLKKSFGNLSKPDGHRAKKAQAWKEQQATDEAKEQADKEKQDNSKKVHELVVIPVVWRGRNDKMDVWNVAEAIKACVAQQGVDVWVDARRHLKPGQKFAHWEFRGVMLRVEVGPEDVKAGVCVVAKAKEAGDYQSVEKKKVRIPPGGARSLLLALKEFGGLSQIEIERRDGDSAEEEEAANATADAPAGSTAAAEKTATDEVEDELGGNWKSSKPPVKDGEKKKKKRLTKKRRRRRTQE